MKVHFPVDFMAATLTASSGKSEDVVKYVNACREMKIPVLPPDVNTSQLSFTPDGEAIRFGLGAVKGVGEGAVNSVLEARAAAGRFASLTDFCCRVNVRLNNRKVIEALIRSGSFDSLGKSRAALTTGVDSAMDVATAERKSNDSGQGGLFGDEASHDHADRFADLPEWSPDERIRYEKETLGFYITGHPLARFEEEIGLFGDVTAENAMAKVDQNVKIVALLASLKKSQIKKGQNEGKMMAKGVLEDLTGSVPVTIFASLLERVGPWLAEGRPVLVSGIVRSSSAPGAPEPEEGGGIVPVEIIAREIQALEGMREAAASEVRLTTPLPGTLDETFASVREILESAPGSVPVSLSVRRAGHWEVTVRTAGRLAVRPTPEITKALERLLGPGSVRYVYAHS
jgi:DNA polymerase-3 subunit alpha